MLIQIKIVANHYSSWVIKLTLTKNALFHIETRLNVDMWQTNLLELSWGYTNAQ